MKDVIHKCHDEYVNNTEDNLKSNAKCFFSYTKSLRKSNSMPINVHLNDADASDKSSVCDLFARFFNSVYQESDDLLDDLSELDSVNDNPYSGERLCDVSISESEVRSVLNAFDCNKVTSPDNVPMVFYVKLRDSISLPLSIVFNRSLSEGVFPDLWKLSFISPIHKDGSKSNVENYRPVSIICAGAKIFEKVMYQIVFAFIMASIDSCQHGFFTGRSVQTNLVDHITFLCANVMNGGQVDTIYTDFSKAFDMVDHKILLKKVHGFGINGVLLRWFHSYVSNRTQHVVIGNFKSFAMQPTSGVPQGSILGPLLFLMFANDLVVQMNSKCSQLADDLKFSVKVESVADCALLQDDICTLERWCSLNKLKLNISKCAILTTSHKKAKIVYDYIIANTKLNRVTFKKDLGVIFDDKLCFDLHIDMITSKAFKMLGFIFRAGKLFRNPQSLLTLYNSYVRSYLEYCSVVWSPHYDIYICQVERVQRRFTKMLYRKFCWPYEQYSDRLLRLNLHRLESRRLYADEMFLFKIVRNRLNFDFNQHITLSISNRNTRQTNVFYVPTYNTNIEINAPLARMQRHHDEYFNSISLFSCGIETFRSKVKGAYVM